jgi:hypothetical protein
MKRPYYDLEADIIVLESTIRRLKKKELRKVNHSGTFN